MHTEIISILFGIIIAILIYLVLPMNLTYRGPDPNFVQNNIHMKNGIYYRLKPVICYSK
jgi:hypothetical protein